MAREPCAQVAELTVKRVYFALTPHRPLRMVGLRDGDQAVQECRLQKMGADRVVDNPLEHRRTYVGRITDPVAALEIVGTPVIGIAPAIAAHAVQGAPAARASCQPRQEPLRG